MKFRYILMKNRGNLGEIRLNFRGNLEENQRKLDEIQKNLGKIR